MGADAMIQTTQRRERFDDLLDGHDIHDEESREAYKRDALGRYAAIFYEGGSEHPDVVTRETIDELVMYATGSIADDPAWAPIEMIDLDTGRNLAWEVIVKIDTPDEPPIGA
jgi:hypothetical protein